MKNIEKVVLIAFTDGAKKQYSNPHTFVDSSFMRMKWRGGGGILRDGESERDSRFLRTAAI
jgi:hypothetical protein